MKSFAFVGRSPWYGTSKSTYFENLMSEWNGYVAIEKTSDPADCNYDTLNELLGECCPHGGVTFAENGRNIPKLVLSHYEEDNNLNDIDWNKYIIYGFDTLHFDDSREKWPKEAVLEEAKYFENNLIDLVINETNNI